MYTINEMLPRYYMARQRHTSPEVLHFMLPNGRIVGSHYDELDPVTGRVVTQTLYNCSSPYRDTLAVRQDPLDSECGCIILANRCGNFWLLNGPKIPNAQDPSIMEIDGVAILTYIKYETDSEGRIVSVRQFFCRLTTPDEPFAIGQVGEKGGRMLRRIKGIIPVMGRRQKWPTMRGQLTYAEIHHLSELEDALREAPIVEDVTNNDAWVGANQLFALGGNKHIGVFMHIAQLDPEMLAQGLEEKSYFAAAAVFNRADRRIVAMEIILDAEDLPFKRPTKMRQLRRVVYLGGCCQNKKSPEKFRMYGGGEDCYSFQTNFSTAVFNKYTV